MSIHDPDELRELTFRDAGAIWLRTRKPYLKPRSYINCEQHVKHMAKFFGSLKLSKIHLGHLREYQDARQANADGLWKKAAGPSLINHELVTMKGILERAGLWKRIEPHYEALRLPAWKQPKVMSDEEEMRFFAIASSNPDWELAYWVLGLTLNTGASGTELRHLRIEDVYLDERIPCFRVDEASAKNHFRARMVPLTATALKLMNNCLDRARALGSSRDSHYVFPARESTNHWNPLKPASASWLRRSFDALRKAAGIKWLTPHCLRHQHITLRYEAGESEQTIALGVGHQSARMTRHYSSLRRDQQLAAVQKIDPARRFGPQSDAGFRNGVGTLRLIKK